MNSQANYMNPEDFERVLDAIPQLHIRKWMDVDIQMLFKILYWCGLRPGEGIRLEKKDFDIQSRVVYLGKTKTVRTDRAVIPLEFVSELEQYLYSKEDGPLFQELSYNTFYPWLKKLGVMLDIKAWTEPEYRTGEKTVGHIFRKSVGKDMFEGMMGPRAQKLNVIAKHLRHKKPSITFDHYLKLEEEAVKDAF